MGKIERDRVFPKSAESGWMTPLRSQIPIALTTATQGLWSRCVQLLVEGVGVPLHSFPWGRWVQIRSRTHSPRFGQTSHYLHDSEAILSVPNKEAVECGGNMNP